MPRWSTTQVVVESIQVFRMSGREASEFVGLGDERSGQVVRETGVAEAGCIRR